MVFKKSLITIAATGIFAGSALGLEVGDKMPDMMGRSITKSVQTNNTMINFYPYSGSKEGSGDWEYAGAITIDPKCKPTVKPFAIQSFKDMKIYVDMNGDGKINRVFKEEIKKYSILGIRHSCDGHRPGRTVT